MCTLDRPILVLLVETEQHHMHRISNECGPFKFVAILSENIFTNSMKDPGKSGESSFQNTLSTNVRNILSRTQPFIVLKIRIHCRRHPFFSGVRSAMFSSSGHISVCLFSMSTTSFRYKINFFSLLFTPTASKLLL